MAYATSVPVLDRRTGKIYPSVQELAWALGYCKSMVCKYAPTGKRFVRLPRTVYRCNETGEKFASLEEIGKATNYTGPSVHRRMKLGQDVAGLTFERVNGYTDNDIYILIDEFKKLPEGQRLSEW